MRIGIKISLSCLGIAAVVAFAGWLGAMRNEAVRAELDELRQSSIHELRGATEMVLALESTSAATQELLAEAWRERSPERAQSRDAGRAAAFIEHRLETFADRLAESRSATEAALALALRRGDEAGAAAERYELYVWLDALTDEFWVHRELLASFVALAPADPQAASEMLDRSIEPHYRDQMTPLIRAYEMEAQRELEVAAQMVDAALRAADRSNTATTVVAVLLALLVGALLTRSIARPLRALEAATGAIGAGNLEQRVSADRRDELGALARAFNRMVERLQATTVSKSYVDDVIRSMGEILIVTDRDGFIRTVNRAAEEQLGWTAGELVGRELRTIVPDQAGPGEMFMRTRLGPLLPVVCRPTGLWDDEGRPQGQVWVAQNVEHLKRVEEALRRSIADKEVLLREVHHRVKNNLQVISSMLRLQARTVGDDAVRQLFADGESRVRSMALVHEQLYRSGDLAHVDFRAYLESLARNVLDSVPRAGRPVEMHVEAEPIGLPLDLAIACGLIVNELLANALEHAFPGRSPGRIEVRFEHRGRRASLAVSDDGIGMGRLPDSADGSLGLRLVQALVRQIGGESSVDLSRGTSFRVEFDLPVERSVAFDPSAATT